MILMSPCKVPVICSETALYSAERHWPLISLEGLTTKAWVLVYIHVYHFTVCLTKPFRWILAIHGVEATGDEVYWEHNRELTWWAPCVSFWFFCLNFPTLLTTFLHFCPVLGDLPEIWLAEGSVLNVSPQMWNWWWYWSCWRLHDNKKHQTYTSTGSLGQYCSPQRFNWNCKCCS